MKHVSVLVLSLLCWANAQTAPTTPAEPVPAAAQPAAPALVLGQNLGIQPTRLEVRIGLGNTFVVAPVSLYSTVATDLFVTSSDPRLIVPAGGRIRLQASVLQNINVTAMAPHSGTLTFKTAEGTVVGVIPYVIAPAKTFNQTAAVNYAPLVVGSAVGQGASLTYSISNIPVSIFDPVFSLSVGVGGEFATPRLNSANVGLSVRW